MEILGLLCMYTTASLEDYKTRTIDVRKVVFFGIVGLVISFFKGQYSFLSMLGGVLIGIFFYILSIVSKEKIGKGDAIIIAATGAYLGFVNTIILVWISSVLALIAGLIVVRRHKLNNEPELPFIPFMLLGYVLMLTIGTIRGVLIWD